MPPNPFAELRSRIEALNPRLEKVNGALTGQKGFVPVAPYLISSSGTEFYLYGNTDPQPLTAAMVAAQEDYLLYLEVCAALTASVAIAA